MLHFLFSSVSHIISLSWGNSLPQKHGLMVLYVILSTPFNSSLGPVMYELEMFVLLNCFRFGLLTVSACTLKLMKRASLYWIEHKTDFEQPTSLFCLQAAKRMCCWDLTDELWIYADTCKAFGSCWSGLQLPSVRLAKATECRIWGFKTAAKFKKTSLHPVQCTGGLKSLLQLWSGYGKADLLECPFYLLSVIYSMY